jgi:hypothetical protein
LTERLRVELGAPSSRERSIAVMIESQSDLAQDASKYGVKRTDARAGSLRRTQRRRRARRASGETE